MCVSIVYQDDLRELRNILGNREEEVSRLQQQLTSLQTATCVSLPEDLLQAKVKSNVYSNGHFLPFLFLLMCLLLAPSLVFKKMVVTHFSATISMQSHAF